MGSVVIDERTIHCHAAGSRAGRAGALMAALHHAALLSGLVLSGLQLGTLIGGAVITEYVFALPGIGRLVVDAVFARDSPLVQGVILLIAVGFIASCT